jgi:hypothetical protein
MAEKQAHLMAYECPNGHPVELVEMLPCNAKDCMALIAYEPVAHGMALDRQLQGAVAALRALDADLSLLESGADQPGTVGSEWVRERLRPIIAAFRGSK